MKQAIGIMLGFTATALLTLFLIAYLYYGDVAGSSGIYAALGEQAAVPFAGLDVVAISADTKRALATADPKIISRHEADGIRRRTWYALSDLFAVEQEGTVYTGQVSYSGWKTSGPNPSQGRFSVCVLSVFDMQGNEIWLENVDESALMEESYGYVLYQNGGGRNPQYFYFTDAGVYGLSLVLTDGYRHSVPVCLQIIVR